MGQIRAPKCLPDKNKGAPQKYFQEDGKFEPNLDNLLCLKTKTKIGLRMQFSVKVLSSIFSTKKKRKYFHKDRGVDT